MTIKNLLATAAFSATLAVIAACPAMAMYTGCLSGDEQAIDNWLSTYMTDYPSMPDPTTQNLSQAWQDCCSGPAKAGLLSNPANTPSDWQPVYVNGCVWQYVGPVCFLGEAPNLQFAPNPSTGFPNLKIVDNGDSFGCQIE